MCAMFHIGPRLGPLVPHFDCPDCMTPCTERLGPGKFLLREHPIIFFDSFGERHETPIGTLTDGGSIPFIAQPLVGDPIDSPLFAGYILHDDHYQHAPFGETGWLTADRSAERVVADRVLYEAGMAIMRDKPDEHLSRHVVRWVWEGVRIGGFKAWSDHARANLAERRRVIERLRQQMNSNLRPYLHHNSRGQK